MRDMMRQLAERLSNLETHVMEIKQHTTKIENTNSEIEKTMSSMSDQLTSLEGKISGLEKERIKLSGQVSDITDKLEVLERNLIKTSIEIRNVPLQQKETKEDLYKMVQQLSNTLDTNILTDIRDVSRYRYNKDKKTSAVIVEFNNTLVKNKFLNASKNYNKKSPTDRINTTHLGFKDNQGTIYVAEQLTPFTRQLFYTARKTANSLGFAYCWISNGRILMKKSDSSQYIVIKSESQLKEVTAI